MDTVHDLGGRQGFGPIPNVAEDDSALFSDEWKARTWAIAMLAMKKLATDRTGWTVDWYRHVLERLPPHAYLSLDYFEKWILAMMVTSVDEGVAGVQEFFDGRVSGRTFEYELPNPTTERPPTSARFKPGDKVVARRDIATMHTRMTGYVRGRPGVVDSVIGAQPLPDEKAVGTIRREQTYVVRFRMSDLWPESSDSADSVLIDMWDSYLEPTETVRRARRHRDGEAVFSEQWHAQVIALVELLIADGKIDAEEWSQTLGVELDRQVTDAATDAGASYYSAFLSALEQILYRSQFASQAEVDRCEQDWRNAYLSTPHGKPVVLAKRPLD